MQPLKVVKNPSCKPEQERRPRRNSTNATFVEHREKSLRNTILRPMFRLSQRLLVTAYKKAQLQKLTRRVLKIRGLAICWYFRFLLVGKASLAVRTCLVQQPAFCRLRSRQAGCLSHY